MSIDDMNIDELRARLAEAEGNLQAIYSGEIDALLLTDEHGERRVFTLRSADAPYRALVERMQEGAATLSITGDIVYCNQRFADLVGEPLEQVFGASIGRFLPPTEGEILRAMLEHGSRPLPDASHARWAGSDRSAGDAVEHRARRRRAPHADPLGHQLAGARAAREPLEG